MIMNAEMEGMGCAQKWFWHFNLQFRHISEGLEENQVCLIPGLDSV
jgi:hypothetical protein